MNCKEHDMFQRCRGRIWKINPKIVTDEKSWKTWKSSQKIEMNEELVQNNVMHEKNREELRDECQN